MTTVTHATAATGTDSGDGRISKNAWNEGHTVGDDLKLAVLDLSSAQVLALFTTPIEIIPAPGAGLFINVVSATAALDFGTAAYAGNTMRLRLGSAANISSFSTVYTGSVDSFIAAAPASGVLTGTIVNQAAVVFVQTSDPTTGDGTIRVVVRYTIEAWA